MDPINLSEPWLSPADLGYDPPCSCESLGAQIGTVVGTVLDWSRKTKSRIAIARTRATSRDRDAGAADPTQRVPRAGIPPSTCGSLGVLATEFVERAREIHVQDIDVPMLVCAERLREPCAVAWAVVPAIEHARTAQIVTSPSPAPSPAPVRLS